MLHSRKWQLHEKRYFESKPGAQLFEHYLDLCGVGISLIAFRTRQAHSENTIAFEPFTMSESNLTVKAIKAVELQQSRMGVYETCI
jgi:hypothetical protein